MIFSVLWAGLFLIPFPHGIASSLSAPWRESLDAMAESGITPPHRIPFALSPESGWHSWNLLISATLLFVGALATAGTKGGRQLLILLVLGLCILEALVGLAVFLMTDATRARGFVYNSNHHAAFVAMGLPVLCTWVFSRMQHASGSHHPMTARLERALTAWIILVVCTLGWLLGLSRGSLIAVSVAGSAWMVFELALRRRGSGNTSTGIRPRPRIQYHALAAGAFVALLLFAAVPESLGSRFAMMDAEISRVGYWRAAWKAFEESAYIGVGPSGAQFAITRYFEGPPLFSLPRFVHNDLLQAIVELGAVWAMAMLCLAYQIARLLGRQLWSTCPDRRDGQRHLYVRAALCGLLIVLVHSCLDFPLRLPLVAYTFLLMSAWALGELNGASGSSPESSSTVEHS
jgi:hypothetical protein